MSGKGRKGRGFEDTAGALLTSLRQREALIRNTRLTSRRFIYISDRKALKATKPRVYLLRCALIFGFGSARLGPARPAAAVGQRSAQAKWQFRLQARAELSVNFVAFGSDGQPPAEEEQRRSVVGGRPVAQRRRRAPES